MSIRGGRGEVGLALAMLRMLRGWERADLVRALGVSRSWISMIETGKREPSTRTVQRITGALGLPVSAVEEALGLVRSVRGMAAESAGGGAGGVTGGARAGRQVTRGGDPGGSPDAGLAWDGSGLSGMLFELVGAGLRAGWGTHGDGGGGGEGGGKGASGKGGEGDGAGKGGDDDFEEARRRAAELWDRLRRYGPEERRALVREAAEFQSWTLCERLCEESARVGTESPAAAVQLAELAVEVALVAAAPMGRARGALSARLAGRVGPGAPAVPAADAKPPWATWPQDAERWRDRLSGYAWAFVGEARRLAGDPAGAEEALARARVSWGVAPDETGTGCLIDGRIEIGKHLLYHSDQGK